MFSRYEPPVGVPHVLFCDILIHLQTLMLTYVDAMLMLIHPNACIHGFQSLLFISFGISIRQMHWNFSLFLFLFLLNNMRRAFMKLLYFLAVNNMIGILIVSTNTCENCKISNECQKLPFKIVYFFGLHSLFGRSLHKGGKRSAMEIDSISTYIS